MDVRTQIIIRSNPNLYSFLREESYWYKYLNRDPNAVIEMEKAMKNKYKLTVEDRLEKLNRSMSMIHNFMDMMK